MVFTKWNKQTYFLILILLTFTLLFFYYIINFLLCGIDTIWDEGFYMLWLDASTKDIQVTQSYSILNFIGFYFKNQLIDFRLFSFFVKLFTYFTLLWYLKKVLQLYNFKTSISDLFLIGIIFLFSFIINNKVISYRELEQIFILLSWLFALHFVKSYENKKYLLLFLISLSSTLSILVIPPPGILNTFLITLFLILHKINFKYLLLLLLFGFISIFLYSLTISNVIGNYKGIIINGLNSGNSDKRYSSFGILSTYIPLIKSIFSKYFIISLISIFVTQFIKNHRIKFLFYFIYIFYCLLNFDFCTDFIGFLILILIINLEKFNFNLQKIIICLILLTVPFSSIIGSAMPPSVNLYYFLPIWLGLIIYTKNNSPYIYPITFTFILLFSALSIYKLDILFQDNLGNKKTSTSYLPIKNTRLNNIGITKKQKNYFMKVNRILKLTDYVPNSDLFFTFNYDLMTVYAFKGKLSSEPFHRLSMYVLQFKENKKFKTPKYLILDEISAQVMAKNNRWNFPTMYTKYQIGCPDVSNTTRYLYCRNSKQK